MFDYTFKGDQEYTIIWKDRTPDVTGTRGRIDGRVLELENMGFELNEDFYIQPYIDD